MDAANTFVLDGSMTLVWGFTDENDDYATEILDKMPDLQAYVPNLWHLEVANALLVGERRGRTTSADAAHFLAILGTFPIAVDDETAARASLETMQLARAHKLSAYDASYFELAMRLGLPLATLDDKLKRLAQRLLVYYCLSSCSRSRVRRVLEDAPSAWGGDRTTRNT